VYHVPGKDEYEEYMEYARNLPLVTRPDVFGMNENADMMKDELGAHLLLSNILLSQVNQLLHYIIPQM